MHTIFQIIQPLNLNWTNLITAIIGAIVSLSAIYINDRLKNKKKTNDDFQALIDANTKYREEIRQDLRDSKEEVELARKQIEECRKIIVQLEIKNQELEDKISLLLDRIEGSEGLREQLRQCEDRFLNISNVTPAGIFRTDRNGLCTFVNKKWCQLTSLTAEEAMGNGWKTALHPDDSERVINSWNDTLNTHNGLKIVFRLLNRDGKTVKVEGRAIREECKNGILIGYVGYLVEYNICNDTIEI